MNNWVGTGNLVRDPELSYTQGNQTAKCTFTIACNRPRRNGEDQGADYIRIVVWGRSAESCDRYLSKGRKVAVQGEIRTGSYKNKDGQTVYTTDVWAHNVEFLTSSNQEPQQPAYQPQPAPQSRVTHAPQQEPRQVSLDDLPDSFQASEDDIPF